MTKMTKSLIAKLMILTLVFSFAANVPAAGIKERMKARLPEIIKLKAQGIIGEDNKGFLAFVDSKQAKKEDKKIVDAENADRQKVYAAIAKQQKTTAELVGKLRAKQIAQKAAKGYFIQNAKGEWVKKK
jgi:uncharacterized protein YdbL (DUF1318 family)